MKRVGCKLGRKLNIWHDGHQLLPAHGLDRPSVRKWDRYGGELSLLWGQVHNFGGLDELVHLQLGGYELVHGLVRHRLLGERLLEVDQVLLVLAL